MDQATALGKLQQYLGSSDRDVAHEIYHDDAVLEFPQSGERFEGVENFKTWRTQYPTQVDFEIRGIRGRDDFWVGELRIRYDGGPWNYGVSIMEFRDDRIAHETIYFCEPWDAPEWRQPWRAAPAGSTGSN